MWVWNGSNSEIDQRHPSLQILFYSTVLSVTLALCYRESSFWYRSPFFSYGCPGKKTFKQRLHNIIDAMKLIYKLVQF